MIFENENQKNLFEKFLKCNNKHDHEGLRRQLKIKAGQLKILLELYKEYIEESKKEREKYYESDRWNTTIPLDQKRYSKFTFCSSKSLDYIFKS